MRLCCNPFFMLFPVSFFCPFLAAFGHIVRYLVEDFGKAAEVPFEHHADPLCGERRFDVVVAVVVVVVGFEPHITAFVEQVFEVEVAYESIAVDLIVTVPEVPVQDKPVVEQLAGQGQFDFDIGKIAFVASDIGADVQFVADLSQHVV